MASSPSSSPSATTRTLLVPNDTISSPKNGKPPPVMQPEQWDPAARQRKILRRDPSLVAVVSLFWREVYNKTSRQSITLHEYVRVYLKMARCLVPDVDHNTAHASALLDWNRDTTGRPVTGGVVEMTRADLFRSIFEICDHWVPTLTVAAYNEFIRALFVRVSASPVEAAYALYLLDRSFKQRSASSSSMISPLLTRRQWARTGRRPSVLPHDHEWPYYGRFDGDEPTVHDVIPTIVPIAEEKEQPLRSPVPGDSEPTDDVKRDENDAAKAPSKRPISAPLTRGDGTKVTGRTGARLTTSTSATRAIPATRAFRFGVSHHHTRTASAAALPSSRGRVLATRTHSMSDQQFQPWQHLWNNNESAQVPMFMRHFLAANPNLAAAAAAAAQMPTVMNTGGTHGMTVTTPANATTSSTTPTGSRPQSAGSSRSGTPLATPRNGGGTIMVATTTPRSRPTSAGMVTHSNASPFASSASSGSSSRCTSSIGAGLMPVTYGPGGSVAATSTALVPASSSTTPSSTSSGGHGHGIVVHAGTTRRFDFKSSTTSSAVDASSPRFLQHGTTAMPQSHVSSIIHEQDDGDDDNEATNKKKEEDEEEDDDGETKNNATDEGPPQQTSSSSSSRDTVTEQQDESQQQQQQEINGDTMPATAANPTFAEISRATRAKVAALAALSARILQGSTALTNGIGLPLPAPSSTPPPYADTFRAVKAAPPPRGPGLFTKDGHRVHLQRELRHLHAEMQMGSAISRGERPPPQAVSQSIMRRGPIPTRRPGAIAPRVTVAIPTNNNTNNDGHMVDEEEEKNGDDQMALITYSGSTVHKDLDHMWQQIRQLHSNEQNALLTHESPSQQPPSSLQQSANGNAPRVRPLSARGSGSSTPTDSNGRPIVTPRSRPMSARSSHDSSPRTSHYDNHDLARRLNAAAVPRGDYSLSTALFTAAFAPTSDEALAIERALVIQQQQRLTVEAQKPAAPPQPEHPLSITHVPSSSNAPQPTTHDGTNSGRTSYSLQSGAAFMTGIDATHVPVSSPTPSSAPSSSMEGKYDDLTSLPSSRTTDTGASIPTMSPRDSEVNDTNQLTVHPSSTITAVGRPQSAPVARQSPRPSNGNGANDNLTRLESMWMQICLRYPPDGEHHPAPRVAHPSVRPSSGITARPRSGKQRTPQLSMNATRAHRSKDWQPPSWLASESGRMTPPSTAAGAAALLLQPNTPFTHDPPFNNDRDGDDGDYQPQQPLLLTDDKTEGDATMAAAMSLPPSLLALMPPMPMSIAMSISSITPASLLHRPSSATSSSTALTVAATTSTDTTATETTAAVVGSESTSVSTQLSPIATSPSPPTLPTQSVMRPNSGGRSPSSGITHTRSISSSSGISPNPPSSVRSRPSSARIRHDTHGPNPSSNTHGGRSPNPSSRRASHRASSSSSFSFEQQAAAFAARQHAADAAAMIKPPLRPSSATSTTAATTDSAATSSDTSSSSTSSSLYMAALPASSAALLASLSDSLSTIDTLIAPSSSTTSDVVASTSVGTTLSDNTDSMVVGSAAIVTIRDEDENSQGEGDESDGDKDEDDYDDVHGDDDEAIMSAVRAARREQHERDEYKMRPLPQPTATTNSEAPVSFTSSPMSLWARPPSAPSQHHHGHSRGPSVATPIPPSTSSASSSTSAPATSSSTSTSGPIARPSLSVITSSPVPSRPTSARPQAGTSSSGGTSSSNVGGTGMSSDYYASSSSPIPTPPSRMPSSPNLFGRTRWSSSRRLNTGADGSPSSSSSASTSAINGASSSSSSSSSSTSSATSTTTSQPPAIARLPSFGSVLSARHSAPRPSSASTSTSAPEGSFAALMAAMMKEDFEKREKEAAEAAERAVQEMMAADEGKKKKKHKKSKKSNGGSSSKHKRRSTTSIAMDGVKRSSSNQSSLAAARGHQTSQSMSIPSPHGGISGGSSTPTTTSGNSSAASSRPSSGTNSSGIRSLSNSRPSSGRRVIPSSSSSSRPPSGGRSPVPPPSSSTSSRPVSATSASSITTPSASTDAPITTT